MTVQLLAKCGFGASDGGADAAGGQIECGGDLGVAQAAVAQHERGRLRAGEPGGTTRHIVLRAIMPAGAKPDGS